MMIVKKIENKEIAGTLRNFDRPVGDIYSLGVLSTIYFGIDALTVTINH
jgi:hypothetical protein